jgi:hypothetical protein
MRQFIHTSKWSSGPDSLVPTHPPKKPPIATVSNTTLLPNLHPYHLPSSYIPSPGLSLCIRQLQLRLRTHSHDSPSFQSEPAKDRVLTQHIEPTFVGGHSNLIPDLILLSGQLPIPGKAESAHHSLTTAFASLGCVCRSTIHNHQVSPRRDISSNSRRRPQRLPVKTEHDPHPRRRAGFSRSRCLGRASATSTGSNSSSAFSARPPSSAPCT